MNGTLMATDSTTVSMDIVLLPQCWKGEIMAQWPPDALIWVKRRKRWLPHPEPDYLAVSTEATLKV
jgi:hypothetical protein